MMVINNEKEKLKGKLMENCTIIICKLVPVFQSKYIIPEYIIDYQTSIAISSTI